MLGPRPGQSYWNASAEAPDFPRLNRHIDVDFAIIGGGIVGVKAARLMKDRGLTVAVVEARRIGRQVTGKSTAKATSRHGITYQTLRRNFGEDRALLYGEAQKSRLGTIREMICSYRIGCDLQIKPAYTYTQDAGSVAQIAEEADIAQRLGLPASLTRDMDLPFDILGAIRFSKQAQFHPIRYVVGLALTVPGDGCHMLGNSCAIEWEPTRVATDGGEVTTRHVVMATHLALGQVGGYYAQAHPYAEPVIAARIRRVPDGMYINVESPGRSVRTHTTPDGTTYGIAAGNSFKPGHSDEEQSGVRALEQWLTETFDPDPVEYRSVTEDYSPADGAPYIGWSSSWSAGGYLVATGFKAWDVSNGTAAAMILSDLTTGRENPWLDVFDARRIKPAADGAQLFKANAQVAGHFVTRYLSRKPQPLNEVGPGETAILRINGQNIAAFRDEHCRPHAVSVVCNHMRSLLAGTPWTVAGTARVTDHASRLPARSIHDPATIPLEAKAFRRSDGPVDSHDLGDEHESLEP